MDQDYDGINGEATQDQYAATFTLSGTATFSATDVPKSIYDLSSTVSYLTINQDLTIADLNVRLNITHTWDSDLYLHVRSPAGTDVVLSNRRGGSADNFQNTTFDDEASVAIGSGLAPFSGTYRPEQLLSAFDGKNARGTWQLWVEDRALGDTGKLNSWSLIITSNGSSASSTAIAGSTRGGHGATADLLAGTAPVASEGNNNRALPRRATDFASAPDSSGTHRLRANRQALDSLFSLSAADEQGRLTFGAHPKGDSPEVEDLLECRLGGNRVFISPLQR